MNFQQLISGLEDYWSDQGCLLYRPYDVETGAGTFNPATFLHALGPEPWRVGYLEPSRRPADGRYGENPNRLRQHYQFQVILKPAPFDCQDIYLKSLEKLGIDVVEHEVRFVEDDWESPTLGATGLGWEVWVDGLEITQFTYFQRVGGIDLDPICVELTYGLERIAMFVQQKESVYELDWTDGITYGDVHKEDEVQFSAYNFDVADIDSQLELFELYEEECERCLEEGLVLPAYDFVLKCSHTFNLLDARGAISVAERTGYIGRVRDLARQVAEGYLEMRREKGFPLLEEENADAAAAG